jgi:cysteine desulfurase
VLKAIGIDDRLAHGAIRFSLSRFTTDAEIDQTLDVLPRVIGRLRAVMPAVYAGNSNDESMTGPMTNDE